MASIMNPALRKTIQILLFTKYLQKLGLKEPEIPDLKFWKEFQIPPMPDISALLADVENQASANPEDIYTPEYIAAANQYNQKVQEEREKRDAVKQEAEEAIKNARKLDDAAERADIAIRANQRIDEANEEYKEAKAHWWEAFELDTIQKYKKLTKAQKKEARKAAKGETESKKESAKEAMKKLMQSAIAKQYKEYVEKQLAVIDRKVRELEQFYEDCKTIFVETPKTIKRYFTDSDGLGKQMVDEECDKIDRCWENLCEACKELSVDITTMVGKIPNPDVIVVGTAAGVPNPGHKIMVFMENVKKIATDIKKVLMYIKEMKSIAEALGFNMETIEAFMGMVKIVEALTGDYKKQFKNSVKQMQRKTKWIAEINDLVEEPDDDEETDDDGEEPEHKTRRIGYKYAELDVDYENLTIAIKGYRCYCTRKESSKEKKKWYGKSYEKKGGDHVDNKGKKYYWIPAEEMDAMFMLGSSNTNETDDGEYWEITGYDENGKPRIEKITNTNKINKLRNSTLYGAASYNYDKNTTTLVLADGRIVTIDYLASEGDKIKLNDGTFVQVV